MKVMTMCVAIGVMAACGSKPDTGTTVGNQAGGSPPGAAAAATPCPTGDALATTARKAWGKGAGTASAQCVAVRVGAETLWYVDGYFEPEPNDDMMMGMWSALVTPDGQVRWSEGEDGMPYGAMMRDASEGYKAVDLDGDATDEIILNAGYSHGGYDESSLVVMRVTATSVQNINAEIPLSSDNSASDPDPADIVTCDAAQEFVDVGGKKHIAVTYSGQCARQGRVVWAYDGKAMVEVK